jgi:shikimate kinase
MDASGNIFLIGPMGVGKSTVGRRLAEATGRRFIDADEEIERRTGVRIEVIFEIEGEPGFRQREARVLDELTRLQGIVLATGGGAVLDPENRARLKRNGSVVYLSAPVEVLVHRTARDRSRPLLKGTDRRQRIDELLRQREPLYQEIADVVVDTSAHSVRDSVDEICRRLGLTCVS